MAPSPIDIAWAAGLFEGEGSCFMGAGQRQPIVSLVMTDQDTVERFASIMGVGAVRTYRRPPNKRFWRWQVQSKKDVLAALDLLEPHLGTRRSAAAAIVRIRAEQIVSRGEATHCQRGHDWRDGTNVYFHVKSGKRHCRACRRDYRRRSLRLAG